MVIIRKWIQLPPEKGLFFFVGWFNPSPSALLAQLYIEHKGPDGVLRVQYACENTFG